MKAHELAVKLLGCPNLEVVFVEEREVERIFWTPSELNFVDKAPKDNTEIAAPYLELM